jgi:hypothetical protein
MPVDAQHGRRIPSGRRLGRALARVFRGAWARVEGGILAGGVPDVALLREAVYRIALQALSVELVAGYAGTLRRAKRGRDSRSGAVVGARGLGGVSRVGVSLRTKAPSFDPGPEFGPIWTPPVTPPADLFRIDWTLFRPEVRVAAESAALNLAGSVSQTTRDMIRKALAEGLQAGEPVAKIADRIKGEAFSPRRAFVIAQTESSRVMHQGQAVAAKELGVTHWSWLASSDACPVCLSIAASGPVPIGSPFYVWPKGAAAYRVVTEPPAHPNCFCTTTEEIPE